VIFFEVLTGVLLLPALVNFAFGIGDFGWTTPNRFFSLACFPRKMVAFFSPPVERLGSLAGATALMCQSGFLE